MGNDIVVRERQKAWSSKAGHVEYTLHGRDHRGRCWGGERKSSLVPINVDGSQWAQPHLRNFLRQVLINQLFKGKSIYEAQMPQRPPANGHGRGFLAPGSENQKEEQVRPQYGRSCVSLTVVQDTPPGCSQLALSLPCCCPPFTQDLPYCIPPHQPRSIIANPPPT